MGASKLFGTVLRVASLLSAAALAAAAEETYHLKANHPRLMVEDVSKIARRCTGPLADDYRVVKERADAAVNRAGIEFISNPWSIPEDLMNCGLAYLVERELGHESQQYADVIVKQWGDGQIISNKEGSHFGYHALAYDWIYDALMAEQRVRYGDALGSWLRFFTDKPEILLKWGHWEYNQTWGPIHLNIMIPATPPNSLRLAYCFPGAGHVYMRSAWKDPNATWAFFGCGPQYAGHARDDEGHFLICKRGALVSRQGGQGHNDTDYYAGGSLIFNIVTIFDPDERFRRDKGNENDGGLLRHVYESDGLPRERGHIVAFENTTQYTYAAADITAGYNQSKAREVTRQFLYLRGQPEYFVVFDRVEATRPEFRRHFFLHVPTEPQVDGNRLNWLSLPEADGDKAVLSQGRTRMFLTTVLPQNAQIVTRGGEGREAWGHPLEPQAQYNHVSEGRLKPPVCPWRIEVGDPNSGVSTLFLHVFELADESERRPSKIKFLAPAGVDIGGQWQVRFNEAGPLGGKVGNQKLMAAVETAAQYSEEN